MNTAGAGGGTGSGGAGGAGAGDGTGTGARSSTAATPAAATTATTATSVAEPLGESALVSTGCPADREELGRHSWTLLHTMAAYYPDNPTPEQQRAMRGFVDGLAEFYPCALCAAALRTTVRERPPAVESRRALSLWMCEAHNEVSRGLSQPMFACDVEALDRRWRTGRPDCWTSEEHGGEAPEGGNANSLGHH